MNAEPQPADSGAIATIPMANRMRGPRAAELPNDGDCESRWITAYRALSDEPRQLPTEAMLRQWPEAQFYQVVSLPTRGRLARILGWKETVIAIAMADGSRTVEVTRHPSWWPRWPLAVAQSVTLSVDPADDLAAGRSGPA